MHPLLRAHLVCFPPACWLCGRLMDPFAGWRGGASPGFPYLCGACWDDLPWAPGDGGGDLPALDRLWAACPYRFPVSEWVRRLKYSGRDALARVLAMVMWRAPFGAAPLRSADLVLPVPLHPRRLRARGFNQSLLLAHRWRQCWQESGGGEGDPLPPLKPRLLARTRNTRPQVELDGPEREANVAGAFGVVGEGTPLEGLRVLLVDDVATTGSTLTACARALKAAGAARVEALVVARAGGGPGE